MFGNECTKPHQTGMESKWEVWVNATNHFLLYANVDVYRGGWNANSIAGMQVKKGPVMEIPERLNILRETMSTRRAMYDKLVTKNRKNEDLKREAETMLYRLWGMIGDGIDMDALQQDETFEAFMRKRRPELFKEEEEDDDTDY